MATDLITMKDAQFFQAIYRRGLVFLSQASKDKKVFLPQRENHPLSYLEVMSVLAIAPSARKKIVARYTSSKKNFPVSTSGSLAWAVTNAISEFSHKEKVAIEEHFVKHEEIFDKKINSQGLLELEEGDDWLGAGRKGVLIENQAYYAKILDLLSLLTNDDMYAFKKKRLIRSVREKLDGAYVLDRTNSLDMSVNPFVAAFFAPELFTNDDWEKTFDAFLKSENLWVFWGGLRVLGKSSESNLDEKNGDSWFFVNNMTAIVLYRLNLEKYRDYIDKILLASSKNINWQEHAGRPCELVMTAQNKIRIKDFASITLATYIYLYRLIAK